MRLIRLFKRDLAMEIAAWVKGGLITAEQAEAICAGYGLDFNKLTRASLGYRVLVGLGVMFIGLSVITVIGENWDDIPRAVRMSGLVALTLVANLFGLYRFREGGASRAEPWFLLGGMLYGASIMLIAQIYHIGEHFPDGIFWWAMGVLPLGLLLESGMLMALASALGFTWFFVESSMDFYPTLFPLFLLAFYWRLRRGGRSYIMFFSLIAGVSFWAEYTLAWLLSSRAGFDPGAENVALGAGIFLAFHGLSKWLSSRADPVLADYGALLDVWVLRFALVSLLVLSFEGPWRAMLQGVWASPALAVALTLSLSIAALRLVLAAGAPHGSTIAFALIINLSVIALVQLADRAVFPASGAILFQAAYNVILMVMGLLLIVRGMRDTISHYFFLGVLAVLLTALMRYIDLFDSYAGAAAMFALFAAIFLAAARYWKARHVGTEDALP